VGARARASKNIFCALALPANRWFASDTNVLTRYRLASRKSWKKACWESQDETRTYIVRDNRRACIDIVRKDETLGKSLPQDWSIENEEHTYASLQLRGVEPNRINTSETGASASVKRISTEFSMCSIWSTAYTQLKRNWLMTRFGTCNTALPTRLRRCRGVAPERDPSGEI